MPLLDATALAALRRQQENAVHNHCPHCTAQLWPNYCRLCDEHFTDGHYLLGDSADIKAVCPEASEHQRHRKY